MRYSKDLTGDGMVGALYYNRGHVTVRRNWLTKVLTAVWLAGFVFMAFVVVGSMLNVNSAQGVLETLIAGKSTPIVKVME